MYQLWDSNDFLTNLGYSKIDDIVGEKSILEIFTDAGVQEDEPFWRTPNHFHDPLSNQGFSGLLFGIIATGMPTAQWAQLPTGTQSPGEAYSWRDARNHYFNALTGINTADREKHLAESFRALGQVMHLVEDMSVPEHTRDTGHPFDKTIEPWLEEVLDPETEPEKRSPESRYRPDFDYALTHPVEPDPTLLAEAGIFPNASIPIANLYDFERFMRGSNPEVTTIGPIGLAEYTNANFFCFNTIFKRYDHPAFSLQYCKTQRAKRVASSGQRGFQATDEGVPTNDSYFPPIYFPSGVMIHLLPAT